MSSTHSHKGSVLPLSRGSNALDIDLHSEIETYEKKLNSVLN